MAMGHKRGYNAIESVTHLFQYFLINRLYKAFSFYENDQNQIVTSKDGSVINIVHNLTRI